MTTPVDIANRALAQIGTRSQLTGLTINPAQSSEALYASLLYAPLRNFLLTEGDYGFANEPITAVLAPPPIGPFLFAYEYPLLALRVRQAFPTVFSANGPQPVEWSVMEAAAVRKIYTRVSVATFFCTVIPESEDLWDPIFTEAYTRLLASALAFATENRIEASKEKLAEAISFAGIANLRDQ